MNVISFLLDICPFVGGLKMMIEAGKKKDMTGIKLVGKARGIHFLFGIITLIVDCFSGIGGSFIRGLLKLTSKQFLRKSAVMAARKAGRGTVTRRVLRSAAKSANKIEGAVGKGVKFATNQYRRNSGGYRDEVRGTSNQNSLDSRQQKIMAQQAEKLRNNETNQS
jgi:hypothetical protein